MPRRQFQNALLKLSFLMLTYVFLSTIYALFTSESVLSNAQPRNINSGLVDALLLTFAVATFIWSSKRLQISRRAHTLPYRFGQWRQSLESLTYGHYSKIVVVFSSVALLTVNICLLLTANLFGYYALLFSQRLMQVLVSVVFVSIISIAAIIIVVSKPKIGSEVFLVLVTLSLFYWLYFHSVSQGTYQFFDYNQGSDYDLLTGQLQVGQLGLVGGPWGDWTFHDGVSYLYFGPLPAIVKLLVDQIWTVTFDELTLVFSVINLAAFYILLRVVTRSAMRNSRKTTWGRALFFWIYAIGPLYFLSGRYFVYETAVIFGSTFLIFGFTSFLRYYYSRESTSRRAPFLAISSMLICLAVLSRLNLALCVVPLVFLAACKEIGLWRSRKLALGPALLLVVIAASPIAAAASAFGYYNAVRFNDPLQFGIKYQHVTNPLELTRIQENESFSIVYLWRNAYAYFLLAPGLSINPPYLNYSTFPSWLVGNYPRLVDIEWTSSAFFSSPLLLFAIPALLTAGKRSRGTVMVLFLFLICSSVPSLLYDGNARRYLQDFYPFVTAMAFIGFMNIWPRLRKPRLLNRFSRILLGIVLLWTFLLALDLSVQWAFFGDFARAMNMFNDPSTFVTRDSLSIVPVLYANYLLRKKPT